MPYRVLVVLSPDPGQGPALDHSARVGGHVCSLPRADTARRLVFVTPISGALPPRRRHLSRKVTSDLAKPLARPVWNSQGSPLQDTEAPESVIQVGDKITVIVTEIDRQRRRPTLSRRQVSTTLE
ncbi:S1 RNA-binding domain-containing protein [Streptomyces sp. NPDC059832]|uniref:S1 RNA-binding domain-containing protein n=1 Tax=Streptomyces sp. NPDC059832 TaxID=3346966 RepID=UPI0036540352